MALASDIAESRDFEMRTYLSSMKSMYDNAVLQNCDIYDIAHELTNGFESITEEAILSDSRIIKTLRYAISPSISQMKFGQFFGLQSVGNLENDKLSEGTQKYLLLKKIARKMVEFVNENIDKSRFIWIDNPSLKTSLASDFAKKWTCSIAADQNAQTRYRNWRKEQQEQSIVNRLIEMGYVKSGFKGIITKHTDINIGEYTNEVRVKGRTIQKADVVFRSRESQKLVLVEAKAVGVELDATKRIKECCDKANDWSSSEDLSVPLVVSVIAGFFKKTNISNLLASGVKVVWEHRLSDLEGCQ